MPIPASHIATSTQARSVVWTSAALSLLGERLGFSIALKQKGFFNAEQKLQLNAVVRQAEVHQNV